MNTVHGLANIKATILAYSINQMGNELPTWEIEYPRLILAEANTHKMLSKNSFSSRAVPFPKMVEQLQGRPVRFGANQPGMQDKGEDFHKPVDIGPALGLKHAYMALPEEAWEFAKQAFTKFAKAYYDAGYHKQVYNRLIEAFQMQKTVITGTETDNFFWLRNDTAADPTIHELARCMQESKDATRPILLKPGQWHLPYIDWEFDQFGNQMFFLESDRQNVITLEQAIKISCARCAAVSYRNEGYDLAKSLQVYDNLVGGERKHASAFEHCATPITRRTGAYSNSVDPRSWEPGVTHMDREGKLWSGNLKGFIQYRKLIPGENYTRPQEDS